MTAAAYDLTIESGVTFKLNVAWKNPDGTPIDMTGYRVHAVFLASGTDSVAADADSANPVAGITVSAPDSTGAVLIEFAPTFTTSLSGVGRYILDAIAPDTDATRLLQGEFVVTPGASV